MTSSSACPLGYESRSINHTASQPCSGDSCPIVHSSHLNNIDSSTSAGGDMSLSGTRVESSIRKQDGSKWMYPSPRQFYKALTLKNKTTQDEKEDMPDVVSVHNDVNERTWMQVLKYEKAMGCHDPSLVRFVGKYDDPSFKAKSLNLFGSLLRKSSFLSNASGRFAHQKTFDTHHWFVERCGRGVNRYVIDYYDTDYNESDLSGSSSTLQSSPVNSGSTPVECPHNGGHLSGSVTIDARPAFDSLSTLIDRLNSEWNLLVGNK